MLTITELHHYPIKSCAGLSVDTLSFDEFGPLADRRWLLVDEQGQFVTQRQLPRMALIKPFQHDGQWCVETEGHTPLTLLQPPQNDIRQVRVWRDEMLAQDMGDEIADWFSTVLQRSVRLVIGCAETERHVDAHYAHVPQPLAFADGFPLLVIHQASLDFLSEKLGRVMGAERFRANVVVNGGQPFDELRWSSLRSVSCFEAYLAMVKPCERCVIPTRHPTTLVREDDVVSVLKQYCRPSNAIVFGQNAQTVGLAALHVGDEFSAQ
ncbi:MAG: MOSC N-terminal beta barrel domain-containing protein [Bacterioplanes sp.]|nr:MOSC N-terminal beta barrel domain-containing protein [Bacterioplanes sp.]